MSFSRIILVSSAISLAPVVAASAARADLERPSGFGTVEFGATTEQMLAAFPALVRIGPTAPPKAEEEGSAAGDAAEGQAELPVAMFQLTEFPVDDLGTCNLIFHTYFDRFAKLDFFCQEREKIEPYLVGRYGPAPALLGNAKLWSGDNQIVYTPHLGTFSYTNKKLHDSMQTQMFLYYLSQGGEAAQPGTAPVGDAKP